MVLTTGLFDRISRNWLLLPLLSLAVLISIYIFLFANNGYLAYRQNARERDKLNEEIEMMHNEIKQLEQKLEDLKDDEKALANFVREFLLYNTSSTSVIKFMDPDAKIEQKQNYDGSIENYQKIFFIAGSAFLLLILAISYKFLRRQDETVI